MQVISAFTEPICSGGQKTPLPSFCPRQLSLYLPPRSDKRCLLFSDRLHIPLRFTFVRASQQRGQTIRGPQTFARVILKIVSDRLVFGNNSGQSLKIGICLTETLASSWVNISRLVLHEASFPKLSINTSAFTRILFLLSSRMVSKE